MMGRVDFYFLLYLRTIWRPKGDRFCFHVKSAF